MSESPSIRLGTRGSRLARWQADWVAGQLRASGVDVQLVTIQTTGDVRSGPIGSLATQGVFTKEIQRALLASEIDLAVHSLKDLPTESVRDLKLAAVPPRAAAGDAWLDRHGRPFDQLPAGSRVGTGSLRRRAQVLHARPHLELIDVRGNLETRIAKLEAGQFDALILAEAGLQRLELTDRITEVFDKQVMLPAVGQGALGLEIRDGDSATETLVQRLNDPASLQAVLAERALLATLRGGCLAPVGAWARFTEDELQLDAVVLSPDGQQRLHVQSAAAGEHARQLGIGVAEDLLAKGAADLIALSRGTDSRG